MSDAILPQIWYLLIIAELVIYILLDGANLGVGILSLLPQKEERRSSILHALGPTWNANETWLLVAAGSLFGAFPAVFGIALNALYIPGVLLLVAIIMRAVSFEFYDHADNKRVWSVTFGLGSLILALGQGLAIGALLEGIPIANGHFSGGSFWWATPLAFLFAIGVTAGYVVLGYAYLIARTDYDAAHDMFRGVILSALAAGAALTVAAFVIPMRDYSFIERWTIPPASYTLDTLAVIIALSGLALVYKAFKKSSRYVYALTLLIVSAGLVGMVIGVYPAIVPPHITFNDVASPPDTLRFMLYGVAPVLPIILAYNWYLIRVFRRTPATERKDTFSGTGFGY